MGSSVIVVIVLLAASPLQTLWPTEGKPLTSPGTGLDGTTELALIRHGLTQREDKPVLRRRGRDVDVTASTPPPVDLPHHHGRYLSQPPVPVDDGYNERSMCKWRYEDNIQPNRFPSTLKVAVKEYTGSRCRDPATGAPRADLACLPIDYELNVLRKNSEGEWHESVEYVTIGFTCAGSNPR
ncbi:Hypp4255 [Branchiostoma lanceolatum]|uniref:Hypp4255 protein n=1 Tax=Branchiostoma lanceolatum TaxID=7740 RepID=A0A8K0EV19_BRALA|nr:Hypp4255 [Branchiostoma lanceolatum]